MSNPFEYFDHVFCINLTESIDRRNKMIKEFESIGINNYEFISAQKPNEIFRTTNFQYSGEFGCVLSHLKAITHAIKLGCENPLFLEDDIEFINEPKETLTKALTVLPDYKVFYLSGNPQSKYHKIHTNLVKVDKFLTAQSYSIKRKYLLDFFDFCLDKITLPFPHGCFDGILNDFGQDSSYCVYPQISRQYAGHSDIRNAYRDYKGIPINWKNFGDS